jgi:hypothetical protein
MTTTRLCCTLLGLALAAAPTAARDLTGDLPAVGQFLERDKSYAPPDRAQARAALARLQMGAKDMSPAAFQLAVAHIAALARNGHTMLLPGPWAFDFNRTPLRYHLFADGLRVLHAPPEMRELLGARVLAIDGYGVDALRQAFARYFGGRAGKRDEWLGFFIESPALLQAAGLARANDRVDVQFELASGEETMRTLVAALDPPREERYDFFDFSRLVTLAPEHIVAPATTPLWLQGPRRAFAIAALPELDAHYLQLRINKSFYEQKIDAFLNQARATLKKAKTKHLVVDLRLDGGGDLNTTREFFQRLPGLLPRDGRIFVLTSGHTFSAGIASAGYLKQAAPSRVTIVGEPIGDRLEFWAEGGFIDLPASKAVLLPATERHNYQTGCQQPDCHRSIRRHPIRVGSLEPDLPAPLRYADYRAGRDPALEAVRQALRR